MENVNYNDNNRIVIGRELFEQIILNVNNNDNEYTFINLNDYILFLKIITDEDDEKLFEKVKNIKKEYINEKLRFDKEDYYNDLKEINLKRYKAIKYFSDTNHRITTYCKKKLELIRELDINKLICKLKYKFIDIGLINNIEYDIIKFILDEMNIDEIFINTENYNKNICIEYFKYYDKLKKVKKTSLIAGTTIGLAGLSVLLIPTIFGISALGPIAGGLFATLQSMGITLSIIQSISMTGVAVTIGTCSLSGASIILLPGLIIKGSDIIKDQSLKNEIEIYFNNIIN